MKKSFIGVLAAAVSLFGSAQGLLASDDAVLAVVNKEEIRESQVNALMAALPPQQRSYVSTPEGKKLLLEELINRSLIAQLGRDKKIPSTQAYKDAIAATEKEILFELTVNDLVSNVTVSDAEAQKYYEEHQAVFETQKAVRASHILIGLDKDASDKEDKAAKAKALSIIKEINSKKTSFEDAARKNSTCPSKNRGGDLDFFVEGQMVPEFEKAAFSMKKGEITKEPVRTQFGYHVILLSDVREPVKRSFDEVKNDIKAELMITKQREVYSNTIESLKTKYPVKIMDESKK